jgi:hypothetical protein
MSISRRSFVSSILTACAGAAAVVRMAKPATAGLDMAAPGTSDVTAVTVVPAVDPAEAERRARVAGEWLRKTFDLDRFIVTTPRKYGKSLLTQRVLEYHLGKPMPFDMTAADLAEWEAYMAVEPIPALQSRAYGGRDRLPPHVAHWMDDDELREANRRLEFLAFQDVVGIDGHDLKQPDIDALFARLKALTKTAWGDDVSWQITTYIDSTDDPGRVRLTLRADKPKWWDENTRTYR